MQLLTQAQCQKIGGGVDYTLWGEVGAGVGAICGILMSLNGPMTGAALAFKSFEIVLKGAIGGIIGFATGIGLGLAYEIGSSAYDQYNQAQGLSLEIGGFNII